MLKSKKLEELCINLAKSPPNWPEIISRFHERRSLLPKAPMLSKDYGKFFSETHLDICLEEISRKYPELNICFDPLAGTENAQGKTGWSFYYDSLGRITTKRENESLPYREYDKVLLIDGLPTVFEIKLRPWNGGTGRGREGRTQRGIREQLRPQAYEAKLSPIKALFNSDAGYVIVVPLDVYSGREKGFHFFGIGNSLWNNFKRDKGIVVPFYESRQKFRETVEQKIGEYKLNEISPVTKTIESQVLPETPIQTAPVIAEEIHQEYMEPTSD